MYTLVIIEYERVGWLFQRSPTTWTRQNVFSPMCLVHNTLQLRSQHAPVAFQWCAGTVPAVVWISYLCDDSGPSHHSLPLLISQSHSYISVLSSPLHITVPPFTLKPPFQVTASSPLCQDPHLHHSPHRHSSVLWPLHMTPPLHYSVLSSPSQ